MLKAVSLDHDGNLILVVGLTAEVLHGLVGGQSVGFEIPPGVQVKGVALEFADDDETLVREWATRKLIPPGTAASILEQIGDARAAGESRKVFEGEGSNVDLG